jgi:membrane protein YqaA with SNARE-associated domain
MPSGFGTANETTRRMVIMKFGKIGFWLAVSSWVVLVGMIACVMAGVPGFG